MVEPTRCTHPACGSWTFEAYCPEHRAYTSSEPSLRGIGCVTPKPKVRYRKPAYVRPNDGYVGKAKGSAWRATADAGYLEFARDVRMRSRTRKPRTEPTIQQVPEHHMMCADMAPIGNVDS